MLVIANLGLTIGLAAWLYRRSPSTPTFDGRIGNFDQDRISSTSPQPTKVRRSYLKAWLDPRPMTLEERGGGIGSTRNDPYFIVWQKCKGLTTREKPCVDNCGQGVMFIINRDCREDAQSFYADGIYLLREYFGMNEAMAWDYGPWNYSMQPISIEEA